MTDRLDSMAAFVKAADLGSFTRAAAALGITSQMVGKHVAELEARLGAELLRRTTRRQSLTAIGAAFLERCRSILAETAAAEAIVRDLSTTPRGRLRVNAPVSLGALCLAPVVRDYLRAYPEVEVELALDDRYVDLVDEGYDAVLRLGPLKDSALHARALAPHRLIACAAPAYLARRGTPMLPDELAAHDCLAFLFSTGISFSEWRFERAGRMHVVDVRGRLGSNDARVLLAAAMAGDGVVLQAERIVRDDLATGRLVRVLPDFAGPERPLHLVTSASRRQTLKVRAFVDRVVAALG